MSAAPDVSIPGLLQRRLVIVTGKGGTGKTTVAAALGRAAAARGLRVLVAEMGRDDQLPRTLGAGDRQVGYAGATIAGVSVMRIDPFEALTEYLALELGFESWLRRVLKSRPFRQLMDAAPGWRELITLGKIWHLEGALLSGRPRFDLIVVDAPATGHGLTFLDVPSVVVSAVRAGPLRENARRVEALLHDPERTLLLPVALPEELPVRETVELVARARSDLGVPLDRVVLNRMPARLPPIPHDADARLRALHALPAPLPAGDVLASCLSRARHHEQRALSQHDALARETGLPIQTLPLHDAGVASLEALDALGAALLEDSP